MLSQYFGPCNSNYELQEELNRSIFKQAFRNGQKTQIYRGKQVVLAKIAAFMFDDL